MQRLKQATRIKNLKILLPFVLCFSFFFFAEAANQLGASLYIAPLAQNPRVGNNFTATIKIDSLAESVNAVKGILTFNKDKLEIINVSKIGSILNLWVDEPSFSNIDGTLKFQGGVPNPGFIGNGGTVLHIIFKAKGAGITSLVWKEGEVLASDGKGTNILTNLQNLDFLIEEALGAPAESSSQSWFKPLVYSNIILFAIILFIGLFSLAKLIIRYHDRHFHGGEREIYSAHSHLHDRERENYDDKEEHIHVRAEEQESKHESFHPIEHAMEHEKTDNKEKEDIWDRNLYQ